MYMKPVSTFQYRLLDEHNCFPVLYELKHQDDWQYCCRRVCDYFVLDEHVYERTSTALEGEVMVVYVEESKSEKPFGYGIPYITLGIELRMHNPNEESELITFIICKDHHEIYMHFNNDFVYYQNDEYEVISKECDQNRNVFVLYVEKTEDHAA